MVVPMKLHNYADKPLKDTELVYTSIKYDGHLILIDLSGDSPTWLTSSGKQFTLNHVVKGLPKMPATLVAEFNYGCEGKLGDRRHCGILTTLRTDWSKGIYDTYVSASQIRIRIHDIVDHLDLSKKFHDRLNDMCSIRLPLGMNVVPQLYLTVKEAKAYADEVCSEGYEGVVVSKPDSVYELGSWTAPKRTRGKLKLKPYKEVDLLCIGTVEGLGKCNGIGALVLRDKKGRTVEVGSGLTYDHATRNGDYVGKVVTIKYEQITPTSYIQPVFVSVHTDKTEKDID